MWQGVLFGVNGLNTLFCAGPGSDAGGGEEEGTSDRQKEWRERKVAHEAQVGRRAKGDSPALAPS